jgi:hypothetical protein
VQWYCSAPIASFQTAAVSSKIVRQRRGQTALSKLTGIFTTRKRQLRLPIIVLGAVMIVFVIIPRIVAYNCSASFNLKKKLDSANIAKFQPEFGVTGCKFQLVTLADFYALNSRTFNLARGAEQLP